MAEILWNAAQVKCDERECGSDGDYMYISSDQSYPIPIGRMLNPRLSAGVRQ